MQKLYDAHRIVRSCLGTNGVWADPTRYRGQCWTRDFGLAIQPLLLRIGETEIAAKHLRSIEDRQLENGRVPILFLDGVGGTARFLADKIGKSLRDGKTSFMLRRWFDGELEQLTPGTKDSEILYVIAACEHEKATGTLPVNRGSLLMALAYIERNLLDKNGLHCGCDWRDTMEKELGDTPLLTNNSLLVRAYALMGLKEKAEEHKRKINKHFWGPSRTLLDYPGSKRFDPLGGSLAVLCKVVSEDRYRDVIEGFRSVDTKYGVTIRCRHNPTTEKEAKVIDRTDGVVVWPFVVGFSVIAIQKIAKVLPPDFGNLAQKQFEAIDSMSDFREWYDPATGKGYGAGEQLWSATLYARAYKAMQT